MNLLGKYNNKKVIASKEYKKYQKKYQDVNTKKVVFVNQYSIKNDKLKFTNYLERKALVGRNMELKNHINYCITQPSYFDNNFEGREVSLKTETDIIKIKRLNDILNLYSNRPKTNEIIFKAVLKDKQERGFQLYFTMADNTKYIYIIDLYHLIIPSKSNRKKQKFFLIEEYEHRKKYEKDIKEVLFS